MFSGSDTLFCDGGLGWMTFDLIDIIHEKDWSDFQTPWSELRDETMAKFFNPLRGFGESD